MQSFTGSQRAGSPRATRQVAALAAVLGAALFAGAVQAQDLVVNRFDFNTEIDDWRFDFGGVANSKTFSTDDAGGNAASGSMQLTMTFPASNGDSKGAYTNDEFFPGVNLAGYALEFDVKVVDGSAPDAFGNNGFFQAALRNTDNYNFVGVFGDNVRVADGWRHVRVDPLIGPIGEVRALTLQLYGGPAQNIAGTVDLRIDNVVFTVIPEPGSAAVVGLGAVGLLTRRRRA